MFVIHPLYSVYTWSLVSTDSYQTINFLLLKAGIRIRIHFIRIRIRTQHFRLKYRSGSGSNPDPGVLMTKNWKQFKDEKKLNFFGIKNYNLPIPRASLKDVQITKEAFSSQKEHPALQNMIFVNFFYFRGSFFPSWIRIRVPKTRLDPDPQPCLKEIVLREDYFF
jgi:hypothetical protein